MADVHRQRSTDSWSTVSEYKEGPPSDHEVGIRERGTTRAQHEGLAMRAKPLSPTSAAVIQDMNLSSSSSGILFAKEKTNPYLQYTAADYITATMAGDHSQAGGLFKANSGPTQSPDSKHPPPLTKRSSFRRIASWLTGNSNNSLCTDDGSLADFHESEWTPPDSSYGAAIPLFGCIPKNMRRLIEFTMIALLVVGLVCLVVTASLRATEGKNNNNSSNTGGLSLNDDYYIEYSVNDDAANAQIDDQVENEADDKYEYDYYGDEEGEEDEDNNGDDADDGNYANRVRRLRLRRTGGWTPFHFN